MSEGSRPDSPNGGLSPDAGAELDELDPTIPARRELLAALDNEDRARRRAHAPSAGADELVRYAIACDLRRRAMARYLAAMARAYWGAR